MLADVAEKYYLKGDYNCAESVLLAANEVCGLGLDENCFRLVSAFGGGMGCGAVCGALAGSMAVLGLIAVTGRAHETEGFKDLCAGFAGRFEHALGALDCAKIKPIFFTPDARCLATVRRAADELEKQLAELKAAD